jgi:ERCC4-type nuclease
MLTILQDTREQNPFLFLGDRYADTEVRPGTLFVGDYTLVGLEAQVAVERKELSDLLVCLGSDRERFERELARAAGMSMIVVVEASWTALANGQGFGRSHMNPHAACMSVLAMQQRYGVPFLFCGSRQAAEYAAWGHLRLFLEGAVKKYKAIVKAHGEAQAEGAGVEA